MSDPGTPPDKRAAKKLGLAIRNNHKAIHSYLQRFIKHHGKDSQYTFELRGTDTGVYLNIFKMIDGEMRQVRHLTIHDDDDKENVGFASAVHVKDDTRYKDNVFNIIITKDGIRYYSRKDRTPRPHADIDRSFSDIVSHVAIKTIVKGGPISPDSVLTPVKPGRRTMHKGGGGYFTEFNMEIHYVDESVEHIDGSIDSYDFGTYETDKLSEDDYEYVYDSFVDFRDFVLFFKPFYQQLFDEYVDKPALKLDISQPIMVHGGYYNKMVKYIDKINMLAKLTSSSQ
jgi:hypothetical protein